MDLRLTLLVSFLGLLYHARKVPPHLPTRISCPLPPINTNSFAPGVKIHRPRDTELEAGFPPGGRLQYTEKRKNKEKKKKTPRLVGDPYLLIYVYI